MFGKDFLAAERQWTKTLCEQDSDGDGRSNGDELGDPNCVWKKGGVPSRGIESQILARRTSLQQLGLALVQPLALLNSSNFCPAVSPRHAEANLFQDHNPGGHAVLLTLLSIDAGPASVVAPKGTDTKAAGAHSVIAKSVPSKTCVQASL